jgi:hypothetical protein
MAFMSSSAGQPGTIFPFTFLPTSEKLNRTNFQSWKAQVTLALKGAQMGKFIELAEQAPSAFHTPEETKPDGKKVVDPEPNPDYASWVAKDQTVLNYLLSNMSKEILGHVNTCVTASNAWAVIEALFASQSWAKIISTRMTLATASKGTSTISEYFCQNEGVRR